MVIEETFGSGLQMFARYAYPPNERGFCGPDDHRALLEYRTAGVADAGLKKLAQAFLGPWPYLKLIAERTGAGDPFDERIVEAYWVGNELLDEVDILDFGNTVEERFRPRVGRKWTGLAESIPGGVPHHSFHVFVTYPWVGLLDSGRGEPLEILDRCRIRWGRVMSVHGDRVIVNSKPLEWDGRVLSLGVPRAESAILSVDGLGFTAPLIEGDWVSLHWEWVCDRLTARQLRHLRHFSRRQLALTNAGLAHHRPGLALG